MRWSNATRSMLVLTNQRAAVQITDWLHVYDVIALYTTLSVIFPRFWQISWVSEFALSCTTPEPPERISSNKCNSRILNRTEFRNRLVKLNANGTPNRTRPDLECSNKARRFDTVLSLTFPVWDLPLIHMKTSSQFRHLTLLYWSLCWFFRFRDGRWLPYKWTATPGGHEIDLTGTPFQFPGGMYFAVSPYPPVPGVVNEMSKLFTPRTSSIYRYGDCVVIETLTAETNLEDNSYSEYIPLSLYVA